RALVMPAIALAMAAGIYLFSRDGRHPAPSFEQGDRARAERLVAQGKEKLARALDPAAADWTVQATEASRNFQHAIAADGDFLPAREGAARAQALLGYLEPPYDHLN